MKAIRSCVHHTLRHIDAVRARALSFGNRTINQSLNSNRPIDQSTNQPISSAGFTLIELLVVLALIVTLASMGMAQYKTSVTRSREAVLKEDLFRMRDAIDQYYADKGKYPATLDALVSEGYMRKLPVDPFTNSSDTWATEPAEPDPSNPGADPGVYNVKRGAQGTGLDGTSYTDW